MLTKDTIVTYAQYNEDIIIAALLSETKDGFYVDVGANHETYHSVTKFFYERGWRGINIEPIPRLIKEFENERKRDINLQIAVSMNTGELLLRDYPEHDGLSTLSDESKKDPTKVDLPHTDYKVKVDSLKNIFKSHHVERIDFLKVDVEGYESEVLHSNDWQKYRPKVICIEANHRQSNWYEYIESKAYVRVIFDGLNEYYLAKESEGMMIGFAERATLLEHNSLHNHHKTQWSTDLSRIEFLEKLTDDQDALIKSTQEALRAAQEELDKLVKQSFRNKNYKQRVKLAAKSLTTDYYRTKKSRS